MKLVEITIESGHTAKQIAEYFAKVNPNATVIDVCSHNDLEVKITLRNESQQEPCELCGVPGCRSGCNCD